MGEYFPAEIKIGGKLPARLLEQFLAEIRSAGTKVGGYDGAEFACQNAEELRQALNESGHLFLVDDRASFGMFENLEGFLVNNGIPFDRHTDTKHEFDAENVRFRRGMKRPVQVSSNSLGDNLMDVGKVRPVAKELARLRGAYKKVVQVASPDSYVKWASVFALGRCE